MKKIISVILVLSLLFAFSACTKTSDEPKTKASGGQKVLVVYFSRAGEQYDVGTIKKGNTAIIAEIIAAKTNADIFEIEPTDSRYDLSYDDLTDYAKQEQKDNARPEYKGSIDLSAYDTVYLGYPIWWGDLPMIVYTFLENNDFSGKTVYAFCTHAGSGDAGTAGNIAKAIPNATVNDDVLAIAGTTAQNEQDNAQSKVENWLN